MSLHDITNFDVSPRSVPHKSLWCFRMHNLYLQNANGPSAEAIISFSDLVMVLAIPIAIVVLLFILSLLKRSFTHRFYVEHQSLEFIWTLLPALGLLLLAAPSLSLLYLLDETGFPGTTTKVQGHQWYWVYELNDSIFSSSESYLSPGPLRLLDTDSCFHVRSHLVLRLLITAADVLHS